MTAPAGRRLAVFDIDGTLVPGPSTERRFYRYLLRHGEQTPLQWARYLQGLLKWAPRYGPHTFKKNKAYMSGLRESRISELASAWVRDVLRAEFYDVVVARLREHQENGDTVVLLSGTPDFIAAAIAAELNVDRFIGSACPIANGVYIFGPITRHPFREEKVACTKTLAADIGTSLEATTAYADSIHDLPLMQQVGTPVAVHPDRRLSDVAKQHGWEIIS